VRVAIVGCPNVGKSVLFGRLTGRYAAVSNYPGTTVEIARGRGRWAGQTFAISDTPGLYSLSAITDEERAARRLLVTERPDWLIHVTDARNLDRMLPLTLQLVEAGFRLLLVVNMLDEADAAGLEVDTACLSARLGLPVIGAALTRGLGLAEIKDFLARWAARSRTGEGNGACCSPGSPASVCPVYDPTTETAIAAIAAHLQSDYGLDPRAVALLALQEDPEILDILRAGEGERWPGLQCLLAAANEGPSPLRHQPPLATHKLARTVARACVRRKAPARLSTGEVLGNLLLQPWLGVPVLAAVLYFGLYRFVGGFGAGILVDTLDRALFLDLVNPWLNRTVDALFVGEAWRLLLAHEYGLLTLGLRYAVAIVLPIVGTFFVAFAVLEDSGYLPRLALLADRLLKPLGLSGRALIPLTLGLGCGTMATLVTRTLETRRERLLATFLLSLGVPCSAQLGVVMGVLSERPPALAVWGLMVGSVALTGGTLAARLLPGRAAPFFMEVPPLRLPSFGNIWHKTTARMAWYFREVLPVFLAASLVIWLGRLAGLFPLVLAALAGVCHWLGLPSETALVLLFGFLRRDYGAAGLHDLAPSLPTASLTVAAVTLTLFVPCLAQTVLMFKERGPKAALVIVGLVFALAICGGFALSRILVFTGGAEW
jgi:ferrous iron transport protein B